MTTTVDAGPEPWLADGPDPVVGYLSEVLTAVGGLASAGMGGAIDDAVRVDRISLLEKIKSAAAAAQAAEVVQFARSQVAAQRDAGVPIGGWDKGSQSRSAWRPGSGRGMGSGN